MLTLFDWDEETFLKKTEGSAIRRIGHECWQRNIAVALGNAPYNKAIIDALNKAKPRASAMVQEHIDWALKQHDSKAEKANQRLTARLVRSIEKGLPRDA